MAGKLVDMLTKTGVEVPDWLGEAGAGGCGGGRRKAFDHNFALNSWIEVIWNGGLVVY